VRREFEDSWPRTTEYAVDKKRSLSGVRDDEVARKRRMTECGASLCVDCFSVGAEVFPHERTHPYRVVELLSFPVSTPNWSADEELRLYDGLLRFGPGNWSALSKYVVTKSKRSCKFQYLRMFGAQPSQVEHSMAASSDASRPLRGANSDCLPSSSALTSLAPIEKRRRGRRKKRGGPPRTVAASSSTAGAPVLRESTVKASDASKRDLENNTMLMLSPAMNSGFRQTAAPMLESAASPTSPKLGAVATGQAKILEGYMQKRGDFEHEWDDQAELLLSDLAIGEDDSTREVELKLRLVELYLHRLDEREEKKRFVLDHDLLNFERVRWEERKHPKELRDCALRLRAFSRILTPGEHLELEEAVLEEQQLAMRMREIALCRSVGIRTWEQAQVYTLERRRRVAEHQLRAAKEPLYAMSPRKTTQRGFRYRNRDNLTSSPSADGTTAKHEAIPAALSDAAEFRLVRSDLSLRDNLERLGDHARSRRMLSSSGVGLSPNSLTKSKSAENSDMGRAQTSLKRKCDVDRSRLTIGAQLSTAEAELVGLLSMEPQRLSRIKLLALDESAALASPFGENDEIEHTVRVHLCSTAGTNKAGALPNSNFNLAPSASDMKLSPKMSHSSEFAKNEAAHAVENRDVLAARDASKVTGCYFAPAERAHSVAEKELGTRHSRDDVVDGECGPSEHDAVRTLEAARLERRRESMALANVVVVETRVDRKSVQ